MCKLREDVGFLCGSWEAGNVDKTCVCGLDFFFVWHLNHDAVIGLFLVSAVAVDGKEVSCASSVSYCCCLIWGLDSWLTVVYTVIARTNSILP
jgi:hypothetical protein